MKNRDKILVGITAVAAIGLVVLLAGKVKRYKTMERLDRIAEEGYETAGDILYPLKTPFYKRNKHAYSYYNKL
jgi:hypothetical protein